MNVKTILTGMLMALIGVGALVFTAVKAIDIEGFRGALRLQASAAMGREFDPGAIDVVFGWPPRIIATKTMLANAPWVVDRPLAIFDRVDAEIDPWSLLIGSVRIRALTLQDGRIDLARSPDGVGNWMLETRSVGPVAVPSALVGLRRLTLRRISIDWRGPGFRAGSTFRIGRADADLAHPGDIEFLGSGSWNDNPFEARLTLPGSVEGRPAPFMPRLAGKIIGVEFDIAVRSLDARTLEAFEAEVQVAAPKLSDLGMVLGTALPATPPFKATATLQREVEANLLVDRLTATMGGSDATGRLVVGDPEGRIRIEGELSSRRLAGEDMPAIDGASLHRWIQGFDAVIDWRIDEAAIGLAEAKALSAHLESDRDGVLIDVPAALLGGGAVRATARLLAAETVAASRWEIEASVDGSTLASILGLIGLPALADAEGARADVSLRGPAGSLGAWLGGLSGAAQVETGPGALTPTLAPFVPVSGSSFLCLTSALDVDRGLVVARDWLMDAGADVIALEGSADLRGGIFDARTLAVSRDAAAGLHGRSVEINGPLSAPEATPGPDESVAPDSRLGRMLAEASAGSACPVGSDGE